MTTDAPQQNVPPVRLTAHRGHLIIECDLIERTDRYIPAGGAQIGCTLLNVDETLLGISAEALAELQKIGRSRDDIGDIMMWQANDGSWCAGWLGPRWYIIAPGAQSDQGGLDLRIPHAVIPNDAPRGAVATIEIADDSDIIFAREAQAITIDIADESEEST